MRILYLCIVCSIVYSISSKKGASEAFKIGGEKRYWHLKLDHWLSSLACTNQLCIALTASSITMQRCLFCSRQDTQKFLFYLKIFLKFIKFDFMDIFEYYSNSQNLETTLFSKMAIARSSKKFFPIHIQIPM